MRTLVVLSFFSLEKQSQLPAFGRVCLARENHPHPNKIEEKVVAAPNGNPLGTPYGAWGWSRIPDVG